ncbi:hypothetical protein [Lentimicrobium sp. S6]|uniref:hypothetical protein n=1 Tax=Lentimicrobium sp. S6 TaxID=2735872 RepID=UPI001552B4F9|nr:hypothetical protein [Lentimicrobium sp. S6]NPD47241.1 hypothetical protein [Lentimicrobium sp. S6]
MAVVLGGDAEAYYKNIPENYIQNAIEILPEEMKMIINLYYIRYHRIELPM